MTRPMRKGDRKCLTMTGEDDDACVAAGANDDDDDTVTGVEVDDGVRWDCVSVSDS